MFDMLREGDLWTFDDCNWIRDDELDELDSIFINREELKEKINKLDEKFTKEDAPLLGISWWIIKKEILELLEVKDKDNKEDN